MRKIKMHYFAYTITHNFPIAITLSSYSISIVFMSYVGSFALLLMLLATTTFH